MITPAPGVTRVDYNEVIGRMADRLAAAIAELVMTQVALDAERAAHAATRAELTTLGDTDGTTGAAGDAGDASGER